MRSKSSCLFLVGLVVVTGIVTLGAKRAPGQDSEARQENPTMWKDGTNPETGRTDKEATVTRVPQRTFLQTGTPYSPAFDVKADVVLLAGIDRSFSERARQWREKGYVVRAFDALMRVNVRDYPKAADIAQTFKDGGKVNRGGGTYEIVPTLEYIEYLKKKMERAIDSGEAVAIEMEEPEWISWRGQSGYSEPFKKEWQSAYQEAWQAPDSSPEALYRSNKLKYQLIHRAIRGAFEHAKAYAGQKGRTIDCIVAGHSLLAWVHDSTIGPFTTLCDEKYMDAYRVQVWTATGGVPNLYLGLTKERPFETQFLEYAEAANMVRPTKMRFEVDNEPLGDERNLSYVTWKARWEPGTVASLMFPEVKGYRVLVWPNRQFTENAKYPTPEAVRQFHKSRKGTAVDLDSPDRETKLESAPIPHHYNTESLVVLHAINDVFDQKDFSFDSGPTGVGVLVSDAMLFQRKAELWNVPTYYGLTLPLLKRGMRVEPVHLEHAPRKGFLDPYKILLLEYESQKPQKPDYNQALAEWVKQGGVLLLFGDGSNPFNQVRDWWRETGGSYDSPRQHLFEKLGLGRTPTEGVHPCGKGQVVVDLRAPDSFAGSLKAADDLTTVVRRAFEMAGADYWEQNYFKVLRGPYILAKVFDEIPDVMPLMIEGNLVDLFDPELAVTRRRMLYLGDVAFLYDLSKCDKSQPRVIASASKIEVAETGKAAFSFVSSSATGTRGATRVFLPSEPTSIAVKTQQGENREFDRNWDKQSSTLFLGYDNLAEGVRIEVLF